jgi:hypothetical protein
MEGSGLRSSVLARSSSAFWPSQTVWPLLGQSLEPFFLILHAMMLQPVWFPIPVYVATYDSFFFSGSAQETSDPGTQFQPLTRALAKNNLTAFNIPREWVHTNYHGCQ